MVFEPHLFATFKGVDDYLYLHLTDERAGAIQTITRNGGTGDVNVHSTRRAVYVRTTGG